MAKTTKAQALAHIASLGIQCKLDSNGCSVYIAGTWHECNDKYGWFRCGGDNFSYAGTVKGKFDWHYKGIVEQNERRETSQKKRYTQLFCDPKTSTQGVFWQSGNLPDIQVNSFDGNRVEVGELRFFVRDNTLEFENTTIYYEGEFRVKGFWEFMQLNAVRKAWVPSEANLREAAAKFDIKIDEGWLAWICKNFSSEEERYCGLLVPKTIHLAEELFN